MECNAFSVDFPVDGLSRNLAETEAELNESVYRLFALLQREVEH